MTNPPFEIHRVAERTLLVRFLDDDLARAVARASAVHSVFAELSPREEKRLSIEKEKKPWVKGEWIPGAGNLLLRFDDSTTAAGIADAQAELQELLQSFSFTESFSSSSKATALVVVRFGGAEGEDLAAVGRETGLSEAEVVARLCAAELTVAFVGFSPGFPYLIGLPPELELPRLASPRTRVPAGSVAIAGPFAGIYPAATPGGWRVVGRTDFALFDPRASPPARLAPRDRARFVPA
jgi:KipI family sensor histidine kinase inhibitor